MKARYYLKFSYIGTYFRGAEKLWIKSTSQAVDPETIQGVFEIALKKIRAREPPKIKLSSRTDAGVHALNNTAHVDIDSIGRFAPAEDYVAEVLNVYFNKNSLSIAVNEVRKVPFTFDARHCALTRSYTYRFGILKKGLQIPESAKYCALYPIEEWRRCLFIINPEFDIEKFKSATKYLPGYHDWSSFKKFKQNDKPNKHNRRTLISAEVKPGQSLVPLNLRHNRRDYFDYWDIDFVGRGFVHNQIRRIFGALTSVALGRVPVEEIQLMLLVPSKLSWPTRANTASPHGLYLTNVEYDPKDFEFGNEDTMVRMTEESDE